MLPIVLEITCKVSIVSYLHAFFESYQRVPTVKLYDSRYGSPDEIDHITECFDKTTKLGFKDTTSTAFIRFGTTRDNDPSVDVKFGQLKLPGSVNPSERCMHC